MKINKRLEHISKYVDDGSKVIDVGCDHALLSIYLEKNKKNLSIIASDINEGPLSQAKINIKKYNSSNISIRLGDGISTMDNDTDTIVISGMGTSTIIDILNKDIDRLSNIKKMIISPNNDFYELRKFITNIGFTIKEEEFINDRGKFYPIIVCIMGNKSYDDNYLKYGINVIYNKDYLDYLKYLLSVNERIIVKAPNNLKVSIEIENSISNNIINGFNN